MHRTHDQIEDLLEVRGDLPRLAWEIGARLVACEFGHARLVVPADPALAAALTALGAQLRPFRGQMQPEAPSRAADPALRHARRHVQLHVARLHADDEADDGDEAEDGPPAANA
ncbi:hypothetical protein [Phaeovulum sp.]|uniref:hypothetical protein n=1 Tax=Phaeovulum sp. TaxID=2934796 RepID=UPI0035662C36